MSGLDCTPDEVLTAARQVHPAAAVANVVVDGPLGGLDATLTDGGYEGPDAVSAGLLAAAHAVASADGGLRLHYGDVDALARGPWLVLAPLGGFVATVATGTATATVVCPLPSRRLSTTQDRLEAVLSAARARHDHYPVDSDDEGVFRTGMTQFSLNEVAAAEALTVRFDVSTTPATTTRAIVDRFAALDFDVTTMVEFEQGVERATPSSALREAVEDAHRAVLGDAQYEWLSRPTLFSRVPSTEKVAFGVGTGTTFSHEEFARTRDLLDRTVDGFDGGASS